MRKPFLVCVAFGFAVSLAGCGARSADSPAVGERTAPQAVNEPVTVKFAASGGMFPQEDFIRYVADPVKKKYPHITLQRINTSDKGMSLDELVAAGEIPDIVANYPGPAGGKLRDLGLVFNMEPLMKTYNFDLGRFAPEAVETLKIAGGQDYLVGLPAYTNAFALFYNKDIFDKFGVAYPKDGMFWEEIADLAKKLTRVEGGVQYRGIFPDGIGRIQQQLSIPFADFNKHQSLVYTDAWQQAFQLWGSLFMIPGLSEGDFKVPNAGRNQQAFIDGTLAMIASHTNLLFSLRTTPQVNWDMVTYPQNKKAPGIGQRLDSPILSITAQSKAKDAAFQVIETILSDEVQTDMMRNGRMTVLKDEKIKMEFGKALTEFQGKNLAAMTKLKFAVMTPFEYLPDGDVNRILSNAFNAYIANEKDLNTALREADEEMNKLIQEKMKR
jgi:multiple sugar transport system substrate-binding protein